MSNEQAARKLEERWMFQAEVQDYRSWLIREVLALQSQLESTETALTSSLLPHQKLRAALRIHWLTGIECDHDAKRDIATCACGLWTSNSEPNVGAAVNAWIEHVFENTALASIPGSREDKA